MRRNPIALLTGLSLLPALILGLAAHEIPGDVTIRAYLKPDGDRVYLLVRVPLEAMRDLKWPRTGPGYLDLENVGPVLSDAAHLWISDGLSLYENGSPLARPETLATRISLPSDQSFGSFEQALSSISGPGLPSGTQIIWEQGLLDVAFQYQSSSEQAQFSVRPGFERLGLKVTTVLFFVSPDGPERAFRFSGNPGIVRLDPHWNQAAWQFVKLGIAHILDGFDHLLFLLCLVIPFRRFRPLVVVVTSFTVAHSITLLASAFGVTPTGLWFPPLIETLIAISIVYMAIENIIGANLERRWLIAFGFGLVHGFGFSFALQETLQFAGRHLVTSLLSFNIGVEIGQILVIAVMLPALHLLFSYAIPERLGTIVLSVLVGHTAWHWMTERGQTLSVYPWPEMTNANVASALRWMMAALILSALLWLTHLLLERVSKTRRTARQTAVGVAGRPFKGPGFFGFAGRRTSGIESSGEIEP